ncbi:MAG: AraC family transcriptional regulator [Cyanobacteria bacterium P01_C01_bin.120]
MPHAAAPLTPITRMPELTQLKGWLADGALQSIGWRVEHVVLPPDAIVLPPLADHTLGFWLRAQGDRSLRFAGQAKRQGPWENHFFLLPQGIPSELAWNGQAEAVLVSLSPAVLQQTLLQIDCLPPEQLVLKPLLLAQDKQITRFIACLLSEIRTGDWGSSLCGESLMTSFAVHLLRHYCTTPIQIHSTNGGLSRDRLRQALEVIHASLDQPLRLDQIADALGLDVYYFSRLFHQSMGVTPYQYVLRQRVEKAKKLLRNRQLSITEIALECGFTSSSHLARRFRKLVGVSPKAYRQQVR